MTTGPEPLRLPKPVTVDELLRAYILRAGLAPNDPLPPEPVLCEMLGVSRNRLREAVQRLQALDVLDVRHGVGTFVGQLSLRPLVDVLKFSALVKSTFDRRAVRDILDVRIAVDRGMAPIICERVTEEGAAELLRLCEQMNERAAAGEMYAELDRQFHIRLAEMAGNDVACELVVSFWDVMDHIEVDLEDQPLEESLQTVEAHVRMVECARDSDVAGYGQALEMHYASAVRRLSRYVSATAPGT